MLSRPKTKTVADKVIDQLDTYREMELISSSLYGKLSGFRVLLDAINDADIAVSGMIKQNAQVVVFVPAGQSEVWLRNSEIDTGKHYDAAALRNLSVENEQTLLNEAPWKQVGQIRSGFIHVFTDYPANGAVSAKKYLFVSFSRYQKVQRNAENCEDDNGYIAAAYYDATRFRIQLSSEIAQDSFVSFEAALLPEKIDFERFGENSYSQYDICAPAFAQKALVYQALAELMPAGMEITVGLTNMADREKRRLLSRMPKNHGILTVEPNF